MKLSLKKLFYFFLSIAFVSSLLISAVALHFNSQLAGNQNSFLKIFGLFTSRYIMNDAISNMFEREQDILLAKNVEDIKKIPAIVTIGQKFEMGLKSLSEFSDVYPNIKQSIDLMESLFKNYLLDNQKLFELTNSKIVIRSELETRSKIVSDLLQEMRNQAETINGKILLESTQAQHSLEEKLRLPNLLDSPSERKKFEVYVSQFVLSSSSNTQRIGKLLNYEFSNLSEIILKIAVETNLDELQNLKNNKLLQQLQLIEDDLKAFKTSVQSIPDLYQTAANIEIKFKSVFAQTSDPAINIVKLRKEFLEQDEKVKTALDETRKIRAAFIAEFNALNRVADNLKVALLENSKNIIEKNHIALTSIMAVVFIVFMTLGYYLLRTLTNSLSMLTNTMKKISNEEGNLSHKIEEIPYDDLNEVGKVFNIMTGKLQFIYANLENLIKEKTIELSAANENLKLDMQKRIEMEQEVAMLNQNLIAASRQAGMVDVATSVLHNIGNILNSVVVSISLLQESFKGTGFNNLVVAVSMLKEHLGDISNYLTEDQKGKLIPSFLVANVESLSMERESLELEVKNLRENINRIEDIVAFQQKTEGSSVVAEEIFLPDMIEKAIQMCNILPEENIAVEKKFKKTPTILSDKFKLFQIIMSLILNAKDALTTGNDDIPNKRISIEIDESDLNVEIVVRDNGFGIKPENLTKIFSLGFSTKTKKQGFGLHSSALAAKELDGDLQGTSEGVGQGALFTLILPRTMQGDKLNIL